MTSSPSLGGGESLETLACGWAWTHAATSGAGVGRQQGPRRYRWRTDPLGRLHGHGTAKQSRDAHPQKETVLRVGPWELVSEDVHAPGLQGLSAEGFQKMFSSGEQTLTLRGSVGFRN